MKHVHMLSGGGGSWASARIVITRHPDDEHVLLFADTLYEDADLYRFLADAAASLTGRKVASLATADDFPDYRVADDTDLQDYAGNRDWRAFLKDYRDAAIAGIPELVWLVEGRDPWEVFRDERLLGNSRFDPCSKILKRQQFDSWREANCDPATTIFHTGIGSHEPHRFDNGTGGGIGPRMAAKGWRFDAPLIGTIEGETRTTLLMREAGLAPPRLYGQGYVHNNCGGFCIKAGKAHYANRHQVQRDRFEYDAMMEAKMREFLKSDVSILSDRIGGPKTRLTLREFGERLSANTQTAFQYDNDSGCGCMIDGLA